MRKPEGWDTETPKGRNFERPKAGAYICKVVKAEEKVSKTGKQMLALDLDIAEGKCEGFYKWRYTENTFKYSGTARWGCTLYQLTEGGSLPYFKDLINHIEQENNFVFDFDERKLVGKRIGIMFVEEEYINKDGEVKTSLKPSYPLPIADIISKNYETPRIRRAKLPQDFSNEEVPF